MEPKKDYYAILGVLPSIDDAALTAVSRALLKKYHPGVAKGQNTDRRAADIIEAYWVLGDADLEPVGMVGDGHYRFETQSII
jgi:DnaJ-class molecular chaperone